MTKRLKNSIRAFRREDGSMVVEFALWFPIFVALLGAAVELGMISVRHMMLERGLDVAIRHVKLNTANPPQHDQLKDIICQEAMVIPDCSNAVKLEMRPQNLRNWVEIPTAADCVDRSEDVQPASVYTPGTPHEMMILRACAKFKPIFPTTALGATLSVDGAGEFGLIATNAFVQEP